MTGGDKEAFKDKLLKFLGVEDVGDVDVREDTPGSWYYTRAQMVSLVTAAAGAGIYYTTDGTIPSAANGARYTAPFAVNAGTTLKAIAVKAGMCDSEPPAVPPLPQVATPVATRGAAVANGARWHWWTFKCATPGAAIYYTEDGTTPSAANGTCYTHDKRGITVLDIDTLKAIAVKADMTDSTVLTQPPVAPLR